jgi:hypothetical protein
VGESEAARGADLGGNIDGSGHVDFRKSTAL